MVKESGKTGKPSKTRRAKPAAKNAAKNKALPKLATGIRGLDDLMRGGLPEGRATLVSGGPGSGKSVLCLEFLWNGATAGATGILVNFEERVRSVHENAMTFDMDLAAMEAENRLFVMDARLKRDIVLAGDFNISGLLAIIEGKAREMGAKRVVLDGVDVLLRIFDDPARERHELSLLHDWLIDKGFTVLMTVKASLDPSTAARYEFLDFMVDCVIHLDHRVNEQISTRRLRVLKYRGSGFSSNEHPYFISDKGIQVNPVTNVTLEHRPLGKKMSTGLARLDTVLDGGYRRGACILVSGTSGTGKTTLAATFAEAASRRGERVLYVSFEESGPALIETMLSPGINLRPAVRAGTLSINTFMPESMGPEEHLHRMLARMAEFDPAHLILDTVSACQRMGSKKAAFNFIARTVNNAKERGTTCILINQTDGFMSETEISGIGMSSMVDSVIFLRYLPIGGEINRTLLVMKSRGSRHSNQLREYVITDHGIDLADVYVGEGGVLTGVARAAKEAEDTIQYQKLDRNLRTKELELLAKQAERAEVETEVEELRLQRGILEKRLTDIAKARGEDTDSRRLAAAPPKPKRATGRHRRS